MTPTKMPAIWLPICEQRSKLIFKRISRCMIRRHQMDKSCRNSGNALVDGLQAGQQLQSAKAGEGAAALKLGDVQGHVGV